MNSQHLTLACEHCGRAAVEFALLPADPTAERWEARRDRLERTEFIGTVILYQPQTAMETMMALLRQRDFVQLRRLDPDFIGFYCHACQRVYCANCWQINGPVFDDGFYDYTTATCPQGHEQIVDD